MPKPLFPPEILDFSAEVYYAKQSIHSRIIYLSILLLIVMIIALLPVIEIDVSTQSRGVIRSPLENTIIQSSVYGEIVYSGMAENKAVSTGDTLLMINTEQIDEKIKLEHRKKADNTLFIRDLDRLLRGNNEVQTPQYRTEYRRYRSQMQESQTNLDYLQREFEIARDLYEKNVISKSEYLKEKNNRELAVSANALLADEYRTNWQSEQTRLEQENQTIESAIRQLEKEKNNYFLLAPTSGTLNQVAGFQAGNYIMPNQVIATISTLDSLLIECYLSPFDIGYISEGQTVVCQIDAYDYRYWGLVEGSVIEILNDVVEISGQPMFRVRCKLKSHRLQLKNGYEGCLKKGMTLTCRFQLARRSLWQLLFDKVDNWMNPQNFTEK